jgi:predicted metal-dependent hydrolase
MTRVALPPLSLPSGRVIAMELHRRRGARRLILRVDPTRALVRVSGPLGARPKDAAALASEHGAWIEERLSAAPAATPFTEGATIPLRGVPTRLVRRDGRGAAQLLIDATGERTLLVPAAPDAFARRVTAALKTMAQSEVHAAASRLAPLLGVTPSAVAVRDARSRWGSCSASGRIMVSWRLIAAPPAVLTYVVAHELAHLREMNHSPRFWAHVASLCPAWKDARAWLRKHGAALHALG